MEDNSKFEAVKATPVALSQIKNNENVFSAKESYLCLYIYKGEIDESKSSLV